jgi:hypothetical protein
MSIRELAQTEDLNEETHTIVLPVKVKVHTLSGKY